MQDFSVVTNQRLRGLNMTPKKGFGRLIFHQKCGSLRFHRIAHRAIARPFSQGHPALFGFRLSIQHGELAKARAGELTLLGLEW
jgi:hypothetical protein